MNYSAIHITSFYAHCSPQICILVGAQHQAQNYHDQPTTENPKPKQHGSLHIANNKNFYAVLDGFSRYPSSYVARHPKADIVLYEYECSFVILF
jgi:hypothetical protein